ncbi:hypothetical protein B0A48_14009 [Cryoendolithus antarcticus]|uniref:F-box domain-containing protein n=1 Tax=Cryoendolithus antarcticus TaxID=1507870 RepID=A0A1V8SMX1_9PEZI|nr:hypothetical protein B0A48_14009 [Cryoendolithus antarcticus]
MDHLTTTNASIVPGAMDLLLVFPRLAQRAGSFAGQYMPDIINGAWSGGSVIAEATGGLNIANGTVTNTSGILAQHTATALDAVLREAWSQGSAEESTSMFGTMLETVGKLKNFGGIFAYLTSRWALATFTVAIVLNRAQFYASSREHLRIRWHTRLAIYLPVIMMFGYQMLRVLEALRCQTSPDFSQLRYGDPAKYLSIDFGGETGFLYDLSSRLLYWKDDEACCCDRDMSLPGLSGDSSKLRGSMSLLFSFFLTLCGAQFLETVACSLQGVLPVPETGMTIFEHSLAFAECEAMISSSLGLGFFGRLPTLEITSTAATEGAKVLLTRAQILQRLNVPPEVLLVCLITCCSQLSSAILAITGKRHKVRLVNTAIWGSCYMAAFLWSFLRIFMQPIQSIADLGVLRFPTVCVVGFIPHVIVLFGIAGCGAIYGLAFLITMTSVPHADGERLSIRQRAAWTYQNLQANVQMSQPSSIRIKMSEDFYTALLKVGFSVLTAASEAVYLNAGTRVQVARMTWVERKRLDEMTGQLQAKSSKHTLRIPTELLGGEIARGVDFTDEQNFAIGTSPYARERKSKQRGSKDGKSNANQAESGLGVSQRRTRMQLTFDFVTGVFWLSVATNADLLLAMLREIGVHGKPAWLVKLSTTGGKVVAATMPEGAKPDNLEFYILNSDGGFTLPTDPNVDVEAEMRRKLEHTGTYTTEESLDKNVYSWWRSGGWFGDLDNSGDYEQSITDDDDDNTSVISSSTNASMSDAWSEVSEGSGTRTPTQRDPYSAHEPGANGGLDIASLSRLLNPQSLADREEARMLSVSLQSNRPITRSQYRRSTDLQRAELLMGPRSATITAEEEEHDIERFILERRSATLSHNPAASDWETGAEGMGAGGPHPGGVALPPDSHASRRGLDGFGTATPAEQLALDAAFAASLQEAGPGGRHGSRRLSPVSPTGSISPPPSTPSAVIRNRIEEYEKASTPPTHKKRSGPAFEILKKPRAPGDKRSPITELPNEVLTHALAHLTPSDLSSVSLVSKRFHELVTTPHAWRSAFSRFFPGAESVNALEQDSDDEEAQVVVRTQRRAFTRLTALASWRSEYILRTRLLRSLSRGKPVQAIASASSSRAGQSHTATPVVMYNSQLFTTVNHLDATFGTGLNKRYPRFIHGADDVGTASSSDPNLAKPDQRGLTDPQSFLQFSERFPGDAQYGLGPGEVVGVPNVMDVSQAYGMVHGEGSPGGLIYFRSIEEMRGRFLLCSSAMTEPEVGIPKILSAREAICSIWLAKSNAISSLTDGLIGMLSGSSAGVLTAYAVGSSPGSGRREDRYARGEMTARWALSPGVPLIAINVDNDYSMVRQSQNRIWATVLNALGEVFYLTKFPRRPDIDRGTRMDDKAIERTAWLTGRTVYWNVVEPSRRVARPDPYAESRVDGSYSPRSSWNGMCLSKAQITAETREIEDFAARKPMHFQKACIGWDMQRRLEVDFAADDGHNAGEGIFVINCGLAEESEAYVRRYARCRVQDLPVAPQTTTPSLTTDSTGPSTPPSLFGEAPSIPPTNAPSTFSFDSLEQTLSQEDFDGSVTPRPMIEEWRISTMLFGGLNHVEILASAIDKSAHAAQIFTEDPLLGFPSRSAASSPIFTPMSADTVTSKPADIPGQRARLMAVGTHTGSVIVWDMRAPLARDAETINFVEPVRIIYTDSPQISSLALSSLYLLHGGNDGLVQAWDVLASTTEPIRTLNSKFASRARRRLIVAQASPQGVGINLFAAGAICLDLDATVLRGMVSIGTVLLYWSFSSSAADQYRSQKRRLRRSERGSNNAGERLAGVTRSNVKDYIANEKLELEREKQQRRKETHRFAGRFGTELLDGSEEEMVAYAAMLSQETHEQEQVRRSSDTTSATDSAAVVSSDALTPAQSPSPRAIIPKSDEEFDADVAEAIRLSLAASNAAAPFDIPIRKAKTKGGKKSASNKTSPQSSPTTIAGSSGGVELGDLDFAIQLSLAEERSRTDAAVNGNGRAVSGDLVSGKGKGRLN